MTNFRFIFLLFMLLPWMVQANTGAKNENKPAKSPYVVKFHPSSKEKMYEAIDSNDDGELDTFYYYHTDGKRTRQEIDTNHDGKVDVWIYFRDGIYIQRIAKDTDHDGRIDTERTY